MLFFAVVVAAFLSQGGSCDIRLHWWWAWLFDPHSSRRPDSQIAATRVQLETLY